MGAGDRAHEQDDREHHQSGCDDRGGQADLPFGVQESPAGGDENEHERPEHLGEQTSVLEFGIVEFAAGAELERQQALRAREIMNRGVWGLLNWHGVASCDGRWRGRRRGSQACLGCDLA
jgi:hypothetical protein